MLAAKEPKKFEDKVRRMIDCSKCGSHLAKIDSDGTVHIKPPKGPEVIITGDFRVMIQCEPSFQKRNKVGDFVRIFCGEKTLIPAL